MTLDVIDSSKNKVGSVEVVSDIFGREIDKGVLHRVVKMQLTNRRRGTASTKERGDVRGGGKKPWRQKGTGRARVGTIRSPLWVGGGTVFGPHPRDYSIKVPKKVRESALKIALSDKVNEQKLVVLDKFSFEKPKTKDMVALMSGLGLNGSVLIVINEKNENLRKSAQNLSYVDVLKVCGLNVMDILRHDFLLLEKDALQALGDRLQ